MHAGRLLPGGARGAVGGRRIATAGASIITGGPDQPSLPQHLVDGHFLQPTILGNLAPDSPAWTDEIFGPVLSVMEFDTEDEAIALANESPYGLAHAVMTADPNRNSRVASRLKAGVVCVGPCHPHVRPTF